jgi:RNA polymerase sigma-70 factor (ECF subfamily)
MHAPHETEAAYQRAAFVARESYGRLVAYLATHTGDLAAAEDALGAAFVAALERWPRTGVPERPESWLLTVARRKLIDSARHAALLDRPEILAALGDGALDQSVPPPALPDERIRLMLVCAHPAIDATIRSALMLQAVLGLEAKAMASAFLVSTETMTKRLVRAKAKIRAAGLRFEEPTASDMPRRLHTLLEAIYAAYFLGREGAVSDGDVHDQLRDEAFYLARVVATALPRAAEALGFLALLTFCEARRPAQVSATGAFVPLLEQDARTWDAALMREGYLLLERAAAQGEIGPFQLEAAIQAAHCYRARAGTVPWGEITRLYQALVIRYPTIGSRVGFAVATAHAEGDPSNGLALLNAIDPQAVRTYQPFWVAMWHLHTLASNRAEARDCLLRALSLSTHPRLEAYLRSHLRP